jgi:rod shape-determining protein MreB
VAAKKRKSSADLFVGIDLGTARSAVVTSAGTAMWDRSLVGWPRDMVAKKLIGKSVVIGNECLEQRLALDIARPLRDGVIHKNTARDEAAIHALAAHLLDLVGATDEQRILAVIGAPAEANAYNKGLLREAFTDLVDAAMVVSEPFTVAYGLDLLIDALVIDIGAGTIDLCIMRGTVPTAEDQRTIPQAGDFIDQQFAERLRAQYPQAQFTDSMVVQWKEQFAFVGEASGGPLEVSIPVAGAPKKHDISAALRGACESILPHLREELRGLIASFDPEFQERIRGNVLLAGGGSQIKGLDAAVEEMLEEQGGGQVRVVEDPLFAGANGALAIAQDTDPEDWQRLEQV